jgi:raffinose/stachyose/melibiose transport system permease protein
MKKKTLIWKRDLSLLPVIYLAFILYTAFFIIPALYSFFFSLTDWNGYSLNFKFIGLKNFFLVFQNKDLLNSVKFTLFYTLIINAATIPVAILFGIMLTRSLRGTNFFRSVFFYPAVFSMLSLGLIFNEIFRRMIPTLAKFAEIDFLMTSLLSSKTGAVVAILIMAFWQNLSIPTVLIIASLQGVPGELIEAAIIDGAGAFRRFLVVTLPYILSTVTLCLIRGVRDALVVFDYVVALTQGGPAKATTSMGYKIYLMGSSEMKFAQGCATAIVLFAFIAVSSGIIMRIFRKGEIEQQ